jgi:23S rRNA pseudouridine2604 synthase
MDKIRIQKYCSERGLASRRETEEYLKNGWIKVNGVVVTEPGTKVDPENDVVEFLDEVKNIKKELKYIILNKPRGFVTNLPNEDEKEASTLLSPVDRSTVYAVGRLDKESEGFLFFTNDGVVANRLKSPDFEVEKEYQVITDREISPEVIKEYAKGFFLDGERLKPVKVKKHTERKYTFILTEGKNRQIRRMLEKSGYKVYSLKRLRIGIMSLKDLKPGTYRALAGREIDELKKFLKIDFRK